MTATNTDRFRVARYTPAGFTRFLAADGRSVGGWSDAATFPTAEAALEAAAGAGWARCTIAEDDGSRFAPENAFVRAELRGEVLA